jgi:hypothetical protein
MNLRYKLLRLLGYKTFDEMNWELKEGRREHISHQDVQKSTVLERALYPKDIHYPQTGEIYLCIKDAPISYITHWMKPYTGGDDALFPKGEKLQILEITQTKPTSVYCQALNANKIEKLVVPESDREQIDYDGYNLVIDTLILNKCFKLVN